nr:MAG TPA: PVL ORF-50-like family [Caudoviricetes sp.]
MPRTKLDRFSRNPETYWKMVNKTIEGAMLRQDMKYHKTLGEAIGLSETQISNRFKIGWSAWELFRISQVLHFTEAEAIRLMGGQA